MIQHEAIPPAYASKNVEIRLHANSPHTYYGTPYASPATIETMAQMAASQYREEIFYINNTYDPVTVMSRSGLTCTIPYTSSCSCRDFTIKKIIHLKSEALLSTIRAIQAQTSIDDAELQEIKKCLSNIPQNTYTGASVMIDYAVSADDIKGKGNTLYHYQTDLVLSFKDCVKVDPHPYSTKFLNVGSFGVLNTYDKQSEFNLKFRYVNHTPNAAPVYVNMFGKVFCMYPQKDAPMRSVLYKNSAGKTTEKLFGDYVQIFYTARNDATDITHPGVAVVKMTLEEAKDKIGLYDSYAEAIVNGNTEINRKEELLKLNHKLEVLKQKTQIETTTLKAELDAKSMEQKQQQATLDIQMQAIENQKKQLDLKAKEQEEHLRIAREHHENRIKLEQMHWRDHYDTKNMVRKDTVEFFKYVPGLVLALGAIATMYMKMSSTKPA